ncbi:MAG: holo-ACP synthase [Bacillota bacterium]|nr:holo-ACP synthase [Bacillota bacterium]
MDAEKPAGRPVKIKTGIDISDCARFTGLLLKAGFTNRVYTEKELSYINSKAKGKAQTAAGIWSAKEALLKAFGQGIFAVRLKDVEVERDNTGKPFFLLHGNLSERFSGMNIELSISHCREYAVASVIVYKEGNGL